MKRDEQKAEAEQYEKDALHQKAESEYRHKLLLKRAHHRFGTSESSGNPPTGLTHARQDATEPPSDLSAEGGGAGELVPAAAQSVAERGNGGAFDFLGFLETKDPKGQHPEIAAEQKKAAARRGEEKTQTSDAKFDAQFAFGSGLTGAANQPWYAKPAPENTAEPAAGNAWKGANLALEAPKAASEPKKRKEKKEKPHRKEKKSKEKTQAKEGGVSKPKKDVFSALRAEREAREAVERKRARQAVLDATVNASGEPTGKRYHSSFGFSNRRK